MPHAEPQAPQNDALDDLFAYDESLDDVFNADSNSKIASTRAAESGGANSSSRRDLGIDEEIVIAKKRAPIAKLDYTRLLSANGISKLRYTAKNKLKFRGKGHEFSDMQRLLSMYQLWLDDLYPRAKFADGLAIIEKLGHSKRVQLMRKAWIDEGKPKRAGSPDDDMEFSVGKAHDEADPQTDSNEADDIFDSLGAETAQDQHRSGHEGPQASGRDTGAGDAEQPNEDELDALLAESSRSDVAIRDSIFGNGQPKRPVQRARNEEQEDMFANEMEAMQDLEGLW